MIHSFRLLFGLLERINFDYMIKKDFHEAVILSIPVFGDSKILLLKFIENWLVAPTKTDLLWINTPNAEQIVQSFGDSDFKTALLASQIRIPDGMSLVLASRLFSLVKGENVRISERISGVDMICDLLGLADKYQKSVFLLGGSKGSADKTARELSRRYARVRITADEGSTTIRKETSTQRQEILRRIQDSHADILLVGYGAPWQERWIADNKKALQEMGVSVVMVVGGAFEMMSGKLKRAPLWMRSGGLEWLWRLAQEPWRWRRQLKLFTFWRAVLGKFLFGR